MTLLRRTPMPRATKPMRQRSAKRAAYLASDEGKAGLEHMARVKALHCVCCGSPPENEAHHCRDLPEYGERGLYQRMPGAGRKSSDFDTIALCPECHRLFHERRAEFHRLYGRDYGYIGIVRAALSDEDIDF